MYKIKRRVNYFKIMYTYIKEISLNVRINSFKLIFHWKYRLNGSDKWFLRFWLSSRIATILKSRKFTLPSKNVDTFSTFSLIYGMSKMTSGLCWVLKYLFSETGCMLAAIAHRYPLPISRCV